jgi:class 3 adenylate cyclase
MGPADIRLNEQQLDGKMAQLEQQRTWSPRLLSRLESFIASAADLDLFRVNPIQFALERGLQEAEVLDLFLCATRVGLFELDWHIVCPHCGFIVDSLVTMSQVHAHQVCPTCGSERDYGLDDYIQVAFTIAAQVRDIQYHHPESLSIEDFYLNHRLSREVLSPAPDIPTWRDVVLHVTRYLGYVQPGETVRVGIEMGPGILRVTDSRTCIQLSGSHESKPGESVIPIQLVDGRFHSDDPALQPRSEIRQTADRKPVSFRYALERQIPCGNLVITIQNQQDRPCALLLYNPGEKPTPMLSLRPGLSANRLLATQTFRDLFRSEVLAQDETLAIKDITILFTDLKGSTSLYDRIGDAKAYVLVRQHFEALRRVIQQRHGAIVKTIGDSVMAVFEDPVDATQAGLEMMTALREFNRTSPHELILTVGIHSGHSLAVTINDNCDYFGQSINIAARILGLADCNEIHISSDVYEASGVREVLGAQRIIPVDVQMKGFADTFRVYKVAPSAA